MNRIYRYLLPLAVILTSQNHAQDAASEQLSAARKDLQETRQDYTVMRGQLYRDINQLDDQALELGRELRALEQEKERRTTNLRRLEQELEARQAEADYVIGSLSQYGNAFLTRINPAENQLYKQQVDSATVAGDAAGDDLVTEVSERLKIANIGMDRFDAVVGGQRFEGKALRNGSEALAGQFLILGPAGYFYAGDGGFEGVTTFAAGGTELPTAVGLTGVDEGQIAGVIESGQGLVPLDPTMGKAIEVQAAEETLAETVQKGGIVGHAILALGLVAILLTLFKVYEITRFPVPSRRTINEILDDLVSDRHAEAKAKAAKLEGMAGDLVKTGVDRFYEKRRVLEESMFEKLVVVKPRLERFLPFLGLVAAAAPLMGLLGTVLGIIKTFKAMALYGSGNQKAFTEGISEALITTAEGLVVAIPVLVLHGLMKSLARGKFSEVEGIAISVMNGTTEIDRKEMNPAPDDEAEDDDSELLPNPV